MFKNVKKQQTFQLHQISNHSNNSSVRDKQLVQQQHQVQGHQKQNGGNNNKSRGHNQQSSHSVDVGEERPEGFVQRIMRNKKKLLNWILSIIFFVLALWFGFRFLTDNLVKTRSPMFLSSYGVSHIPEVMSPIESDYESFQYYQKMLNITKSMVSGKRGPVPEEMKLFKDMTFKQFYNTYKVIRTIQLGKEFNNTKEEEKEDEDTTQDNIDDAVNLTNYFADVVNQFRCASCYSFPIAATVEYEYRKYGIVVKLSEQQLIDCAHDDPQQNGCEDGNITRGFEYVRDVGLVTEEEYPYKSIKGVSFKCDQEAINRAKKKYRISGFKTLPSGNCQSIQKEVANKNAVAAMINAGDLSSYVESDGTFTDCKRFELNHAITIVGKTENAEWIVRNSWGKNWGANGYFTMGHGNTCGVCLHAIVPVLRMDSNNTLLPYDPNQSKKKQNQ